jgi:AraC-like DNA-binding protein
MDKALILPSGNRQYITCADSDPLRPCFEYVYGGFDLFAPGRRVKSRLDSLAILLTLSGEARHYSGDTVLSYRPRNIILLLPDLEFCQVTEGDSWHSCWLILNGPLADTFLKHVGCRSFALAVEHIPAEMHLAFLESVGLVIRQPTEWKWKWLKNVIAVLEYLGRVIPERVSRDGLSFQACRIMEDHLDPPLSLRQIAELLGVSESQLAHQFRRETGSPPGKVYRQRRIERAKQLLIEGLEIPEVSDRMGFENPFHFSRVFKQIAGVPPSQFRKRISPGFKILG